MHKSARNNFVPVLLVLLSPLWMIVAAFAIKAQTFPFVDLQETSADEFSRPSSEASSLQRERAVAGLPGSMERAREVALLTREEFAHGDGVVLSDWREPLDAEEPLRAICSEYAKFFVAACRENGLQARVVWMQGHTTAEVLSGGRYVVADPNGNLVLRGADRRLLGIADLATGASFEPEHLLEPEAGGRDDPNFIGTQSMWVYSQPKLAVEIAEEDLFSFHRTTRDPAILIGALLGGEPPARGRLLSNGRTISVGGGWAAAWLGFAAMILQAALGSLPAWRRRTSAAIS